MSAGKRFKFNGSEIQFATSFDDDTPGPLTVTAITQADPPVVTVSSTTTLGETGDVFAGKLSSVEGMVEVDDEAYIIQIINGTTFSLLNTDSTDYAAFTGTALFLPAVMTDWCEVTGFNRQGGSSPEIPATTVCSDYAEFEIGLPDFGTAQVDFNYAPATTVQQALEDFQESGDKTVIHYSLPRSGGERWVLGFVQQTGEQGQNGGLWTASMTFRATGKPVTVIPS
jgi:hypothetical protein